MNNQWLNDLRRKMEDHVEGVPDSLWAEIRNELFHEEEKGTIVEFSVKKSDLKDEEGQISDMKKKPLVYLISGFAAAVAFLLIVGKLLFRTSNNHNSIKEIAYTEKADKIKIEDQAAGAEIPSINGKSMDFKRDSGGKREIILKSRGLSAYKIQDVVSHKVAVREVAYDDSWFKNLRRKSLHDVLVPNMETIQSHIFSIKEPMKVVNRIDEVDKLIFEREGGVQNESIAHAEKAKGAKKSWMLGMLTGKISSGSQQFPGYATMSGKPLGMDEAGAVSGYEQAPFVDILLANQNENVEATIRHKVPLNLGFSLYYNVGKRWGIGTGINYTKLSSELHSGSESNFVKSEQVVHYVGVPVQVNYNVIQKGAFAGYLTGGILIEKSVGGSFTTKYVVNNTVNGETKESLSSRPVQVSLNTAVGVQLKIVDKIGVYAEPGIGYYFKNENSLNTIYNEKPLNLNIRLGVRIVLD